MTSATSVGFKTVANREPAMPRTGTDIRDWIEILVVPVSISGPSFSAPVGDQAWTGVDMAGLNVLQVRRTPYYRGIGVDSSNPSFKVLFKLA